MQKNHFYAVVGRRNYWTILPEYVKPNENCKSVFSEVNSVLHKLFEKLVQLQTQKLYNSVECIEFYFSCELIYIIHNTKANDRLILVKDIYQGDTRHHF